MSAETSAATNRTRVGDAARPVIRPATTTDLPRLGRLGALLVEAHHTFDARRFLAARERLPLDYAAFLLGEMHDQNAVVLAADAQGDVIGYAYATVEAHNYMALRGSAGVLQDIIVDPEYRGRGVGRQLLDAAVSALTARGAPQAVLMTAARNEAAQRLFARAGFRPTMIEMTRELDDDLPKEAGG